MSESPPQKKKTPPSDEHAGRGQDTTNNNVGQNSSTTRNLRTKPNDGGPWMWQEKEARRKIREALDATDNRRGKIALYLSTYDALTELASNYGDSSLTIAQTEIAKVSGCGRTTVQAALDLFQELKLVRVDMGEVHRYNTYHLLRLGKPARQASSTARDTGSAARESKHSSRAALLAN